MSKLGRAIIQGFKEIGELEGHQDVVDIADNFLKEKEEALNEDSQEDKLDKAEKGSYYTITGCGGDIQEWKDGYQKMLDEEDIGKIKEWIEFTGKEMNDKYGLTGNNAYPDDLHFLAFPLDGLNVGKLAIFKIQHHDRWMDDIVANDNMREHPEDYDKEE